MKSKSKLVMKNHRMKKVTTQKPIESQMLRIAFMEPVLIELICSGCLDSMFETVLLVSPTGDDKLGYPDNLDELVEEIIEDKGKLRHTSHTEGHGYAYCGMYKATKVWRVWEDPKRTSQIESESIREAELDTMSPEIAEKFRNHRHLEGSSGFMSAVEQMLDSDEEEISRS